MPKETNLTWLHESLEHLANPHICLLQAGWEQCKPGYSYTNYRDMYLIHFIKSGSGTLQIGNQTFSLGANDIFLIRPNQLAIYTSDLTDPWEYYYFAFNGAFAPVIVERTVFKKGQFIHKADDSTLCDLIFNAAVDLQQADIPDLAGLEHLFKFLPLLCDKQPQTRQDQRIYLEYIVPIQQYIEQHYSEPLQTAYLAQHFNINRSYFYRIFKKFTGLSPENYIISLRIQRAKMLIADTDLPLTTISGYVGYENYPPFFSMFKKVVGMSPNEYRQKQQRTSATLNNGIVEEKR